MTTKFTVSLLFIGLSISLNCQITREKFNDIIKEEQPENMYGARENHSSLFLHSKEQSLPEWFFKPLYSDTKAYSIGISDPAMDSANALNLAIHRAIIIGNTLNSSVTKLLCEFYSDDAGNIMNVSYENFARISADYSEIQSEYKLLESYRTKFDETIVLLELNIQPTVTDSTKKRVIMEIYRNETETSIYGSFESVYELLVKDYYPKHDTLSIYQATELSKSYDVISRFDTLEYNIPIYSLRYENFKSSDSTTTVFFHNGLWKEYFKEISNSIVSVAKEKPENISNLSEKSNTSSYKKLTRGISKNTLSFRLSEISGSNSVLKVHLTEVKPED